MIGYSLDAPLRSIDEALAHVTRLLAEPEKLHPHRRKVLEGMFADLTRECRLRSTRGAPLTREQLKTLHEMMDGREWDACTICEELADMMRQQGWQIREPMDLEEDEP